MTHTSRPPLTAIAFPLLAIAFVFAAPYIGYDPSAQPPSTYSLVVSGTMIVIMLGAVFAAVFHADVIAHRVGEPYGTLVLTLAVTIIEVALIEFDRADTGQFAGAGPRHRVCRRHDRVQWPDRTVHHLGRIAAPRAGISNVGRGRLSHRAGGPVSPHARSPELHGHDDRARIFQIRS